MSAARKQKLVRTIAGERAATARKKMRAPIPYTLVDTLDRLRQVVVVIRQHWLLDLNDADDREQLIVECIRLSKGVESGVLEMYGRDADGLRHRLVQAIDAERGEPEKVPAAGRSRFEFNATGLRNAEAFLRFVLMRRYSINGDKYDFKIEVNPSGQTFAAIFRHQDDRMNGGDHDVRIYVYGALSGNNSTPIAEYQLSFAQVHARRS